MTTKRRAHVPANPGGTISLEDLADVMRWHAGGDDRPLRVAPVLDKYYEVGTIYLSLNGSPPRGFGVYWPSRGFPPGGHLCLYDGTGRRWKKAWGVTVPELEAMALDVAEENAKRVTAQRDGDG